MDIFTSANRKNIKDDITKLTKLKTEYKKRIGEQINKLNDLKEKYKLAQQSEHTEEELNTLKGQIIYLENEINKNINVGIDNPFHWFVDFNDIIENGGFDIVIGNPPYVEYSQVRKNYLIKGYTTEACGNLFAFFIENLLGC